MPRPLITLLTDFGTADHYIASMKGVMAGICPDATFVDITHEIAPYAIAEAAWTLAQAAPSFPEGTIHLVVVDPGVGSARRAVVASAGGHFFVGPDNGVLAMAIGADPDVHEPEVYEIAAKQWFRQPVSQTFHGRDVFAPVAARLATGVLANEFGPAILDWNRLESAQARRRDDGSWEGVILKADRFGNLITNLPVTIPGPWRLDTGWHAVSKTVASYSDALDGEIFLIAGSAGFIEICMNKASAMNALRIVPGASVQLTSPVGTGTMNLPCA